MSEERKKNLRTQGRYSDGGNFKGRDKRQKSSPPTKEPPEKKYNKRYSNENRNSHGTFVDEDVSPVKYTENSDYHFDQLENPIKTIEIVTPGRHVLSCTENGESIVVYGPDFIEEQESDFYFERLNSSINWYSKNIVINGEERPQPRLVSWFGPYPYSYSGATLEPAEMPDCVLEIKSKVEDYLKGKGYDTTFNSVLLNLYRNGKDSVAWHSDDELTMGICPTIASVSLGETRRFEMRPKKKYTDDDDEPREKQNHYFIYLTHGSLIVMDGCMQDDWQHRVPKEYHDRDARINLTFRTVYPLEKISHRVPIKKNQVHDRVSHKTSSFKTNFNDDFTPLNDEEDFPPLNHDKDFPPLNKEEFPPLNSDVNPSSNSPSSSVRRDSFNGSSSFKNDDLNKSSEYWDSGASCTEKVKVEKDISNSDHMYGDFAADGTERVETFSENNGNSFDAISEGQLGHPVSPSDETREYVDNKKPPKAWLNVSAKEFVPKNSLSCQDTDYTKLSLEELIHFRAELMHDRILSDYAYHLKLRVMERLQEFPRPVREELDFLCVLSDGSQTDRNQRLISTRIANMVMNALIQKNQQSSTVQRSYDRHPRSNSYGKPNHADRGRRSYQSYGRSSTHRYHS